MSTCICLHTCARRMANVPRVIHFVTEKHILKWKQMHVRRNFIKFTYLHLYTQKLNYTHPASQSIVLYVCPNIPTFIELLIC